MKEYNLYQIKMLQYSQNKLSLLERVSVVIKIFTDEENALPISMSKDNVKCLDFDLDKAVFVTAYKSQVKMVESKPCNKTWLEVMDMV